MAVNTCTHFGRGFDYTQDKLERVGGTRTLKVDVRLVAATNVDLHTEVQAGRFREDLYYRLNVFPIHLPPLRERRDDVPLLMNHFLRRECERHGREAVGFTQRAVRAMLQYAFPGNIRELQNLIERGVILADEGTAIDVAHMFRREQLSDEALLAIGAHGTLTAPVDKDPEHLSALLRKELGQEVLSLADLEQRLLHDALAAAKGNMAAAARRLGLTRAQFAYRIKDAATHMP